MTTKQQLLKLAAAWRKKAQDIEDKYQASVPDQVQVAVGAFNTCAEEIEELARTLNE